MAQFEVDGPQVAGFSHDLEARLRTYLSSQFLDSGQLVGTATLVARRGRLAAVVIQGDMDREQRQPVRADTIFRIYSMSKPLTSIALMMLWEEGRVLLEDPVEKYLPEFADTRVYVGGIWPQYMTRRPTAKMTILNLMTHTSGLTYGFMNLTNVDYGYRKEQVPAGLQDLEALVRKVARLPLEFDPGERFNYSVSTDVLGRVVEVISGMRFGEFLQERIFAPLGMTDTAFTVPADKLDRFAACYQFVPGDKPVLQDPGSAASPYAQRPDCTPLESGGGGLVSTMHDYYRFCQMLANKGTLGKVRLIGTRTLRLMTQNHLPGGRDIAELASKSMFSEAGYYGVGFGLGFSVLTDSARAVSPSLPGEFGWGGMASTAFWVSPKDDDLIVIFMTQLIPSSSTSVRRGLHAVIHGCMED